MPQDGLKSPRARAAGEGARRKARAREKALEKVQAAMQEARSERQRIKDRETRKAAEAAMDAIERRPSVLAVEALKRMVDDESRPTGVRVRAAEVLLRWAANPAPRAAKCPKTPAKPSKSPASKPRATRERKK